MQRLEVSGAVRPIYGSLGVKRLTTQQLSAMTTFYALFLPYNDLCLPANCRCRELLSYLLTYVR